MDDIDLSFDFGFTIKDEDELKSVQDAQEQLRQAEADVVKAQEAAEDVSENGLEKANNLLKAVTPLLNNLAQNPDKDYIYWPGRVGKIGDFKALLNKIIEA